MGSKIVLKNVGASAKSKTTGTNKPRMSKSNVSVKRDRPILRKEDFLFPFVMAAEASQVLTIITKTGTHVKTIRTYRPSAAL
jgi:hypothetical protein